MALTDDLADLMADDFGEPMGVLEGDDDPAGLGDGVEGIALFEGAGITEVVVEPIFDIGDEHVAVLRGGDFGGVDGHDGIRCKNGATVTLPTTLTTPTQMNRAYVYWRNEAYIRGGWWVPVLGWC